MATKELITFLRERLHEDEWVAQESGGLPWTGEVPGMVYLDADAVTDRRTLLMGGGFVATTEHAAHQRHITRHDPASVLRKVTAQRKLIAMWHAADEDDDLDQRYADSYDTGASEWPKAREDALSDALRVLASAYADHPDYRPEWRP